MRGSIASCSAFFKIKGWERDSLKTILKSRHFLTFISTIILCVCFGGIVSIFSFWAYPDEFGYWAPAARLSGYDWSQVASIGSYYSYGYSFILFIVFNVFKNGIIAYRAAIVLNSVLSIVAVWILYRLICDIRNIKSEGREALAAAIISSIAVLYPAWSLYSQSTMSESLICFLFVLVSFLMHRFLKKPGIITGLFLVLVSMYTYLVHMRMIGTVIAIVLTLIIWAFSSASRKTRIGILSFIAIIAVIFLASFIIKNLIVSNVYSLASESTIKWNDYSGQISKIKQIFTLNGIKYLAENICGKALYIGLATYGLGFWGIGAAASLFVKGFKALKDKEKKSSALFEIYIFMAIFFQISIALVYLIDSPSPFNTRLDLLLHGRYTDMLMPALFIFGIYALYNSKHPLVITGIFSLTYAGLSLPIIGVIDRNNTKMSELQGFTMPGVSYMLSPTDSDSKAFLVRAVIFGIVVSFVVCGIIVLAKKTNESVILAGIVLLQIVLSVITCNKYMYSIQPYVYTDILITQKIEELELVDPDRQIIHIFKGGIPYIEVVQFGLRDEVIDVIDTEVESIDIGSLPDHALIVTDADTPLDAELKVKYDTYIFFGHLSLYYNE